MKPMPLSPVMCRALEFIHATGEAAVEKFARATWEALLLRGLVEQCSRLYFGPRGLRYRLTPRGKREAEKLGARKFIVPSETQIEQRLYAEVARCK